MHHVVSCQVQKKPNQQCNTLAKLFVVELAFAAVHTGIFVCSAQRALSAYYCEMSDDEILFPISQEGERKEEFKS